MKARPCEGVARAAGGGAGASRVKAGADGCGGACARGEERRGDGQEWGAGTHVQVTVELQIVQLRWCMASTATGSTREGKKIGGGAHGEVVGELEGVGEGSEQRHLATGDDDVVRCPSWGRRREIRRCSAPRLELGL